MIPRMSKGRKGSTRAKAEFTAVSAACIVLVAIAVIAPAVLPFDPNATNLSTALLPPGEGGFILGSDSVGRDVFLRTVFGGRESVVMSFAIVAISFSIGTVIGLVAGFSGGAVDAVLDKVITVFQAFPSFVLAIAIAAVLGQGMLNMVIAISIVFWTQPARLARSLALRIKTSDAVKAARLCGAKAFSLYFKYLLPPAAPPLAVMMALSVGDVILTMAGLSFLGLGPERPTNEWGAMMSESRSCLQYAPWCMLVPGIALLIAVVLFNLLGDSLRDVLDISSDDTEEIVHPISFAKKGRGTDGRTEIQQEIEAISAPE